MHICFLTNEYPKKGYPHGGVGTFVKTIGIALTKAGHSVSVVGINVYTKTDEFEQDGEVNIYRLKERKIKGLTWWINFSALNRKLEELHKNNPINIVESAELGLAFIKTLPEIKYIIRLHGGHHFFAESEKRSINFWKGYQEKRSFKKADGFIAVSEYVKIHTGRFLSFNNKKLEIIRYPINLDVFKPRPDIVPNPKVILFAGTVCEKKGIHNLLKAMPQVLNKFPEMELHIYGRDWFFPNGDSYIDYLKHEILPSLGSFKGNITFFGSVDYTTLAEKYAEAYMCVFPSLMETQGLVAPEAMAMEKLVVFSECGPGPETIQHKKNGLLCNPYNVDSIANNIIWAIENPIESTQIAKAAKTFVKDTFSIDVVLNQNIEFYKSI